MIHIVYLEAKNVHWTYRSRVGRRRRTPQEKIAFIQKTMEPGMTESHLARLHGINANQIFKWCRQYEDG